MSKENNNEFLKQCADRAVASIIVMEDGRLVTQLGNSTVLHEAMPVVRQTAQVFDIIANTVKVVDG